MSLNAKGSSFVFSEDGISGAIGIQGGESPEMDFVTQTAPISVSSQDYGVGKSFDTTLSHLSDERTPPIPTLAFAVKDDQFTVIDVGTLVIGQGSVDLRTLVGQKIPDAISRCRDALGDSVPSDVDSFLSWLSSQTKDLLILALTPNMNQYVTPNLALLETVARSKVGLAYQCLVPIEDYGGLITEALRLGHCVGSNDIATGYTEVVNEPWAHTILVGATLLQWLKDESLVAPKTAMEGSTAEECPRATVEVGNTRVGLSLFYRLLMENCSQQGR